MQTNEFLAILQLILLTIIFVSTLIIALMVYDMHRISKFSKVKTKKEIKEMPQSKVVACYKCGAPMHLVYDGAVVDGYACPKCGHTEVKSKQSEPLKVSA